MNILRLLRCAWAALLLLLLAAGCISAEKHKSMTMPGSASAQKKPSNIRWLRYTEALAATAMKQDRMMILYFTKDSCSPCKMMEKWTFTDDRVVKSLDEFVPVKIYEEVESRIARRYRVRVLPTIIFAEGWGGEIDRKAGYRDADSMLQWIENVGANHMTISALALELQRRPNDSDILLAQAHNFADAGRIEEALELAQRAADVSPENANVFALFGLCYLRNEKLEEAEAAIAKALQLDAQNEEARRLKVSMLLREADSVLKDNDWLKAEKKYSDVLQRDPENFDAHMGIGRTYVGNKQYDKAIAEFQYAAKLRPNSSVPLAALGDYYKESGDDGKAEEEFLNALETEPRHELPYFRLIELYERNGKRAEMMETYEKLLPIEPAGAHNEVAWLMATSKHPEIRNPEEAIRHANIAVELEPHPWYIDTLAEAYYAKGDYDLAIAIIKEAMAKGPDDMKYYREQREKFQKAKDGEVGLDEREISE